MKIYARKTISPTLSEFALHGFEITFLPASHNTLHGGLINEHTVASVRHSDGLGLKDGSTIDRDRPATKFVADQSSRIGVQVNECGVQFARPHPHVRQQEMVRRAAGASSGDHTSCGHSSQ